MEKSVTTSTPFEQGFTPFLPTDQSGGFLAYFFVTKDKQGTRRLEDLVTGIVVRVLSHGRYYRNGVKVEVLPISSDWQPVELHQIVHEIQEAGNPKTLAIVQASDLVVGRIQYILR